MARLDEKTPAVAVAPPTAPAAAPRRGFGPLISVGVITALLIAWWVATTGTGAVKPLYLPSPEALWESVTTLNTQLLADVGATLGRVLASWIGGSALGVLVGLAMARTRWLIYALNPIIEAVRPVPPVALIPFVILWFGIGDSGKLFLGALACFMVMVVNTTVAVGNVPPVYLQAARSLGAGSGQVYRSVVLPAIVPEILSGFRIGSALAFAVVVAAEFLGADAGIGRLIMQASRTLNTSVVLLGTICIALMAVVLDQAISRISAHITRWAAQR
ncbi:NitT/TauT family transport system permease protein/taurine transport system permease protein [Stackebrandtia endophytica]|uniref:NitT/TauT family transport system permease protein/taurine transport system permease protein n=1 Tax=Stackebrandtia endophytica TaxID=1496996 RepID=A0A543AQ46_9ACTN|nr:ABC transporter permease [Stackebrandtia endophytica]TQL74721.1 NitT/TauT family transport system permease protein/taurine transport system permease protein [Stackebrandtia endophytica]